jgi:hypothetical protein
MKNEEKMRKQPKNALKKAVFIKKQPKIIDI